MYLRGFILCSLYVLLALSAISAADIPEPKADERARPEIDIPDDELIVRLRPHPGAPRPAAVVQAVNEGNAVPGGLGIGGPGFAEFLLPARLQGRMAAFYDENPDLPRARLERSVVIHYPTPAAARGILTALENNPNVEFVEVNEALRFIGPSNDGGAKAQPAAPFAGPPFDESLAAKVTASAVIPDDPFFAPPASNDPLEYQWGSYAMNLPDAWRYVRGHAHVLIIDIGIQADHPDLKAFGPNGIFNHDFIGGNYRQHLSYAYTESDSTEPTSCTITPHVHGTHTSGIVAATPDNSTGVAGACWYCPIAFSSFENAGSRDGTMDIAAQALSEAGDKGIQVVTMSFGVPGDCPAPSTERGSAAICEALNNLTNRDLLLAAAAGNDYAEVELPGTHSDVFAIGAVDTLLAHWNRLPCDGAGDLDSECGSNFSQDPADRTLGFTAPGQFVLSTVYVDNSYGSEDVYPDGGCGDDFPGDSDTTNDADGVGSCTGTSMSSPHAAGVMALMRTANPLLNQSQIYELLRETSSLSGSWDQMLGYGIPNATAAVERIFGKVHGQVITNRATPMFRLYSPTVDTHLFTTSPQTAVGEIEGVNNGGFSADPAAPAVGGYAHFPGDTQSQASASFYVFTGPENPSGSGGQLVPLYRLARDRDQQIPFCGNGTSEQIRSWSYTVDKAEIRSFNSTSVVDDGVAYFPEGIEGYIYPTSATPPAGVQKLYRYFDNQREDWLLLLEGEARPAGYDDTLTTDGGAPNGEWLGWVLPNVDTDGDAVIDAWEGLLGTDPSEPDSDNDLCTDGEELLGYVNPDQWQPSDPLDSICTYTGGLLTDGFETGDTSAWSLEIQ